MMTTFCVRAVLFDMDGTLVDSTGLVENVWARWAQRHHLTEAEVATYAHGRQTVDVVRKFLPHVDAVAEAAALISQEELDPTPIKSIPGALEAVGMANSHAKWAVVTSASRKLAQVRLVLGGFPKPPILITADDVKRGKPDPEGFRRAAEELGVTPSESIVFEDTPAGLEAGRAAGAKTIALTTTFSAALLKADALVADLTSVSLRPDGNGMLLVSVSGPDASTRK